jgi:hypothetical protein
METCIGIISPEGKGCPDAWYPHNQRRIAEDDWKKIVTQDTSEAMKKVTVKQHLKRKKGGGASVVKTHQANRKDGKLKKISSFAARSSFIKDISYDHHNRELCVIIGENAYLYKSVPESVVAAFKDSRSKGSFFATKIKSKYEGKKQSIYGT